MSTQGLGRLLVFLMDLLQSEFFKCYDVCCLSCAEWKEVVFGQWPLKTYDRIGCKQYVSDFEEVDGPFVIFEDNPISKTKGYEVIKARNETFKRLAYATIEA